MRLPEEDLGPAWLRDYDYADFGQIEVDIQAMEQFAAKLAENVKGSYAPHMATVSESMGTPLPPPPTEFAELSSFLVKHNQAQDITHQNVYAFGKGTQGFATAATEISNNYRGSDAFARAKVSDVKDAFDRVGIPADPAATQPAEGGS